VEQNIYFGKEPSLFIGFINGKEIVKSVTYHDPCNLGKDMRIYGEPREVIKKFRW
jgi:Fe-S oxidoreductase